MTVKLLKKKEKTLKEKESLKSCSSPQISQPIVKPISQQWKRKPNQPLLQHLSPAKDDKGKSKVTEEAVEKLTKNKLETTKQLPIREKGESSCSNSGIKLTNSFECLAHDVNC